MSFETVIQFLTSVKKCKKHDYYLVICGCHFTVTVLMTKVRSCFFSDRTMRLIFSRFFQILQDEGLSSCTPISMTLT